MADIDAAVEKEMQLFHRTNTLDKRLVFISGTPRSGTSLITKVIDAHPNIAVLMENIFGNRRRHWSKAKFWNSPKALRKEVGRVYAKLKEPIVGNKVCVPDVWTADDVNLFCKLFADFRIVFIVRDPIQVALSRLRREDYEKEFNNDARKNILIDFRSRFLSYTSSWRQSVEAYWKLRDGFPDKIYLIYYEDFCARFEIEIHVLSRFLDVPFSEDILRWYELPHHNENGELLKDLKYPDRPLFISNPLQQEVPNELLEAVETIKWQYECWKRRKL